MNNLYDTEILELVTCYNLQEIDKDTIIDMECYDLEDTDYVKSLVSSFVIRMVED